MEDQYHITQKKIHNTKKIHNKKKKTLQKQGCIALELPLHL